MFVFQLFILKLCHIYDFKLVVYDLTPPQKMIGFIIPNNGSTRPLQDFAVTVDAIEKETGLDFFSLVSRQEQDRLQSTITLDAWSW